MARPKADGYAPAAPLTRLSTSVAMKISGHKTRSTFDRYNIVDRHDVEQAMEKLAQFRQIEDAKLEQTPGLPI